MHLTQDIIIKDQISKNKVILQDRQNTSSVAHHFEAAKNVVENPAARNPNSRLNKMVKKAKVADIFNDQ